MNPDPENMQEQKVSPPIRALKFLRWFCRKDYIEEIEGDHAGAAAMMIESILSRTY